MKTQQKIGAFMSVVGITMLYVAKNMDNKIDKSHITSEDTSRSKKLKQINTIEGIGMTLVTAGFLVSISPNLTGN